MSCNKQFVVLLLFLLVSLVLLVNFVDVVESVTNNKEERHTLLLVEDEDDLGLLDENEDVETTKQKENTVLITGEAANVPGGFEIGKKQQKQLRDDDDDFDYDGAVEGGDEDEEEDGQPNVVVTYDEDEGGFLDYDADEFEGFQPTKKHSQSSSSSPGPSKPKPSQQQQQQKQKTTRPRPPLKLTMLEILYIGFILLYGLVFFIGKSTNDAIAAAWEREFNGMLKKSFTQVGESIPSLQRETFSNWILYASGKPNCLSVRFNIDLRRRQDLFSWVLDLFWITRDTLTVDILMSPSVMPPVVFGLCNSKDEKAMKELPDMTRFSKTSRGSKFGLSDDFSLLYENSEICEAILTPELRQMLQMPGSMIRKIYISDQNSTLTQHKCVMSFVFRLPHHTQMDSFAPQMKMAIQMIERVGSLPYPAQALQKCIKTRTKLAEEEAKKALTERLEAEKKQKEEKLQKDFESLSPKEREKLEEKERKKQQKAMKPKFKVMRS